MAVPLTPPVIVLVGAGASYASGSYPPDKRPPLTKELFKTPTAVELLKTYALARSAGRVIADEMDADSAVAFEAALRGLRDGPRHHQQMALAVAPFLQALMIEYATALQPDAFRYSALVNQLLKLPTHVCFVSLNYDTLLDNELAAFSPLGSLESYVANPLNWSLIKPHGSVAWFVDQRQAFDAKAPPLDMTVIRQPIQCVPTTGLVLRDVREPSLTHDEHGLTRRYPALALPEGAKDELVWPALHRDHLHRVIDQAPELFVLVLGYSALDKEILNLIKVSGKTIRRLTVVNRDTEAVIDIWKRLHEDGISAIYEDGVDNPYETWIDDGGLRTWVAEYGQFPKSAVAPNQLPERITQRVLRARMQSERRLPAFAPRQQF
jgi:hypothetical protein